MPKEPVERPGVLLKLRASQHEPLRVNEVLVAGHDGPNDAESNNDAKEDEPAPGRPDSIQDHPEHRDRLGPVEPVGPSHPAHLRHPLDVPHSVGEEGEEEPSGGVSARAALSGSQKWSATRIAVMTTIATRVPGRNPPRQRAVQERFAARTSVRAHSQAEARAGVEESGMAGMKATAPPGRDCPPALGNREQKNGAIPGDGAVEVSVGPLSGRRHALDHLHYPAGDQVRVSGRVRTAILEVALVARVDEAVRHAH